MKRALVFAHFDPHAIVDDHVLYSLRCYRQHFSIITFVSSNNLDAVQKQRALTLCDSVITRPNFGYDFLSWKTGLERLPLVADFDQIVFANDSVYGPCNDLSLFLDRVDCLQVDLWGASVNHQFGRHVQSYFMGFNRSLISNGFLREFWTSINRIDDKQALIMEYEVGLSMRVQERGFKIGGVVEFSNRSKESTARVIEDVYSQTDAERGLSAVTNVVNEELPNPVQSYWHESLRCGLPFVKVELLRDNFVNVNANTIFSSLKQQRWYDPFLIEQHLERVVRCRKIPFEASMSNSGAKQNSFAKPTSSLDLS